jgi:adenylate cyclase
LRVGESGSARDRTFLLGEWITEQALGDFDLCELFEGACERLLDAGFDVIRAHLAMGSLHPMFEAVTVTWQRGERAEFSEQAFGLDEDERWRSSPLRYALESGAIEHRFMLGQPEVQEQFPMFRDFVEGGGTDYFIRLVPFGGESIASRKRDGALFTWLTNRENGFSDADLAELRTFSSLIGLAAKIYKREQTTRSIVDAYLGSGVGRRVLDGQIRRGDVDVIHAVIWYSDMRRSTELAERLGPDAFLRTLNDYFECSAGSVLTHGGEVLRFVGDAVLGIFPVRGEHGAQRAVRTACVAAREAREKLRLLNTSQLETDRPMIDFGIALHLGELLFGNIGVASRVEFSVVGTTANEVARIEELTKTTGEPVLVSEDIASAWPGHWRVVGEYELRGADRPHTVYALE